MKFAIPTENRNGLQSNVYGHFGSAPFYAFYNSMDENLEFVDNSNKVHEHGQCQPIDALSEKKVEAVICNGMGIRAVNNLNALGIKVYSVKEAPTIEDLVLMVKEGALKELLPANACQQHNCH